MNFTGFLTKQYLISVIVIVFLGILILPFPTENVPRWKLLVIDENYLPGAKKKVKQVVTNPYFQIHSVYSASTDKNGFVTFPARRLWASISRRVVSKAAWIIGYDLGTAVEIRVVGGGCPAGRIVWNTGKRRRIPDKLVCP